MYLINYIVPRGHITYDVIKHIYFIYIVHQEHMLYDVMMHTTKHGLTGENILNRTPLFYRYMKMQHQYLTPSVIKYTTPVTLNHSMQNHCD